MLIHSFESLTDLQEEKKKSISDSSYRPTLENHRRDKFIFQFLKTFQASFSLLSKGLIFTKSPTNQKFKFVTFN